MVQTTIPPSSVVEVGVFFENGCLIAIKHLNFRLGGVISHSLAKDVVKITCGMNVLQSDVVFQNSTRYIASVGKSVTLP